jgi:hypothetical protein
MTIKEALEAGCSLDYKDLSLCDLRKYSAGRQNCERRYQIYSNDFREVYTSLDKAVKKFFELKEKRNGS